MKIPPHSDVWSFESRIPAPDDCSPIVLLGVDGGATSTTCVCIPLSGNNSAPGEIPRILSRAETSASNRNSVGDAAAKSALEWVLAETLRKANYNRAMVRAVCLALSGIDHPSEQEEMTDWLRELFPGDVKLAVYNDSMAALASGTLGKLQGCVLIAGTGTIAFGVSEEGEVARAAGAGALLGDDGSGYFISQQALCAVIRAHDGRGPPTKLEQAVLGALGLTSPEEIISWVYKDLSWSRIASLVPTVKSCAAAGDEEAQKVLRLAVEGLASNVKAVVEKLNLAGKDGRKSFPLVMVGGVLEVDNGCDLRSQLIEQISVIYPGVKPIQPEVEPALGAAMLALNLC